MINIFSKDLTLLYSKLYKCEALFSIFSFNRNSATQMFILLSIFGGVARRVASFNRKDFVGSQHQICIGNQSFCTSTHYQMNELQYNYHLNSHHSSSKWPFKCQWENANQPLDYIDRRGILSSRILLGCDSKAGKMYIECQVGKTY